jgi:MraZ protein
MDSTTDKPSREAPRGMYTARLDDRGRIKLPAEFHRYLDTFNENLFVTSMDRKTARIYLMRTWRENEALFENYHDDPRVARNVAFTAAELGSEAEMDAQGRIPFSSELREALGIENNQQVRLYHNRGRIDVLSDAVFKARQQQASAAPEDDLNKMEGAGLR